MTAQNGGFRTAALPSQSQSRRLLAHMDYFRVREDKGGERTKARYGHSIPLQLPSSVIHPSDAWQPHRPSAHELLTDCRTAVFQSRRTNQSSDCLSDIS